MVKEFITAVEDVEAEDAREAYLATRQAKITARVEALVAEGKPLAEATKQAEEENPDEEEEPYVEFSLDGRTLKAYYPTEGQLIFMMSAMGRGQTQSQRFTGIISVMLASLRGDDLDYFESRLLSGDKKTRLPMKTIEGVFEFLSEEWFR